MITEDAKGCLTVVLFALLFWALVFGVSFGGRHYDLSCSTKRGVEFVNEPVKR